MKKLRMLVILFIGIFGFSGCQGTRSERTDTKKWNLDGFWSLSSSEYNTRSSPDLCIDFEFFALLDPYALGSHILIKADSVSLFRYPFEYYGTFKFEIVGDSLFIKANRNYANNFAIQKPDKNTLLLNFVEEYTDGCSLAAEAKYESLTPNSEMINKLMRDSISYDSITGKWWYLRTEIGYNDGSEPTILNFPKGMPDSIFVSQELINKNARQPFIELKLNNKMVKMFIKNPYENSFILEPAFKKDEILFCNFIDYGNGRIDTIYRDVIYRR
jgi:hypothetical protein